MSDPTTDFGTPITRPNVYQLVADRLMAEIVAGGLAEGDPVPSEKELSERYGVGRSSVREGLRMLESQGVIELSGRGTYAVGSRQGAIARALRTLLTLGEATLLELHDLRRSIEVEVGAQAALRRTEADIAALEAALAEMAATRHNLPHALDADLAFHLAMARASHNGALIAAITGVREVLRGLIAERVIDLDEALHQHRDILDQIIRGDADKARASVATHMEWISQNLAERDSKTQAAGGEGKG